MGNDVQLLPVAHKNHVLNLYAGPLFSGEKAFLFGTRESHNAQKDGILPTFLVSTQWDASVLRCQLCDDAMVHLAREKATLEDVLVKYWRRRKALL